MIGRLRSGMAGSDAASPAASGLRRIGANAGWLLGARGFQAVLSLFYLALATRTLGLADFGRFTLVVAIGQGIAALVGFQTWQFVIRYGARAQEGGDSGGVERVIGLAIVLDLACAVAGCGLAVIAIGLLGPVLQLPADLHLPAIGFCLAMLLAMRSTPMGVLRLDGRFRDAALADAILPIVRVVGAGLAAWLWPTITGFLCAWAVAELATSAAYWWAAMRRRSAALAPGGLKRLAREEPSLLRFVFMTNLSSTLSATARQVTLILVGGFGGPAAAGTFRVAAQLAQGLAKGTQTFSRAAYPELVRAITEGQDRALLLRLTAIAAAASVATVAVAALLGEPLLHLVATPRFADAYWPVVILVAAAGLDLLGFAFEPAMTARGQATAVLRIRAAVLLGQAGLLVLLLPAYGTTGGAGAILLASLAGAAISGWWALRPGAVTATPPPEPLPL